MGLYEKAISMIIRVSVMLVIGYWIWMLFFQSESHFKEVIDISSSKSELIQDSSIETSSVLEKPWVGESVNVSLTSLDQQVKINPLLTQLQDYFQPGLSYQGVLCDLDCDQFYDCVECMQFLENVILDATSSIDAQVEAANWIVNSKNPKLLSILLDQVNQFIDRGDTARFSALINTLQIIRSEELVPPMISFILKDNFDLGNQQKSELYKTLSKVINGMSDQQYVGSYLTEAYFNELPEKTRYKLLMTENANMLSRVALRYAEQGYVEKVEETFEVLYRQSDDGKGSVLSAVSSYIRKSNNALENELPAFKAWASKSYQLGGYTPYQDMALDASLSTESRILALTGITAVNTKENSRQVFEKMLPYEKDVAVAQFIHDKLKYIK